MEGKKSGFIVLKRRERQCIKIGDDIEVSVNYIKGGTVSLVVRAPLELKIQRADAMTEAPRVTIPPIKK